MHMAVDVELELRFPENLMKPTLAQAASWTRVASIVTAARVIEKRTDQLTPHFFLAFPDDELLEALIVRVLAYFARDYQCSREKLTLASCVDPAIQARTLEKLAKVRLNPTISAGGPSAARKLMPQLAHRESMRILKIVDAPPLLELIFEPFQMLRTTIVSLYSEAARISALDKAAGETSDSPRSMFVHRPYGDGALVATLDALIYFALGLRVGIEWGTDCVSIENGFRCVNIVGQPPLQATHFEVARSVFRKLMKELARP
jgi:hypothetical protein